MRRQRTSGIIVHVPSDDEIEKAEILEDQAYDDAMAEHLEELERLTSENRRAATIFRFVGLAASLVGVGAAAAANALDAGNGQLSTAAWTSVLVGAIALAAVLAGLVTASSQAERLLGRLRAIKREQPEPAVVSTRGVVQAIGLHNHLVVQRYQLRRLTRKFQAPL